MSACVRPDGSVGLFDRLRDQSFCVVFGAGKSIAPSSQRSMNAQETCCIARAFCTMNATHFASSFLYFCRSGLRFCKCLFCAGSCRLCHAIAGSCRLCHPCSFRLCHSLAESCRLCPYLAESTLPINMAGSSSSAMTSDPWPNPYHLDLSDALVQRRPHCRDCSQFGSNFQILEESSGRTPWVRGEPGGFLSRRWLARELGLRVRCVSPPTTTLDDGKTKLRQKPRVPMPPQVK